MRPVGTQQSIRMLHREYDLEDINSMSKERIVEILNFSNENFTYMNQFIIDLCNNLHHYNTAEEIKQDIYLFMNDLGRSEMKGFS